jgi:hypothetical protein
MRRHTILDGQPIGSRRFGCRRCWSRTTSHSFCWADAGRNRHDPLPVPKNAGQGTSFRSHQPLSQCPASPKRWDSGTGQRAVPAFQTLAPGTWNGPPSRQSLSFLASFCQNEGSGRGVLAKQNVRPLRKLCGNEAKGPILAGGPFWRNKATRPAGRAGGAGPRPDLSGTPIPPVNDSGTNVLGLPGIAFDLALGDQDFSLVANTLTFNRLGIMFAHPC